MKDKLRELAEMVREAYRAGFTAACKWRGPVTQDADSPAYNREFNAWSFSVREKHAAILDAEGDGRAVSCEAMRLLIAIREDDYLSDSSRHRIDILRNERPARSGVVSDEDVDNVLQALGLYESPMHRDFYRIKVRTALEHFAKGERHER